MSEQPVRQARAEQTRSHIIETAAVAFGERGFDGVSLNDLVRASRVSKGAFYFHFPSKDALALAVFRAKQRELIERLLAADEQPAKASERVARLLRRRTQLLQGDRSLSCVTRLGSELNTRSAPRSEYASFQDLALDLIADVVGYGQRTGEFRTDLDPEATARSVFAWIVGIDTLSQLSTAGGDLGERSEEVLALLLPALMARPGSRGSRPPGHPRERPAAPRRKGTHDGE